jgi:hypothetical protein
MPIKGLYGVNRIFDSRPYTVLMRDAVFYSEPEPFGVEPVGTL